MFIKTFPVGPFQCNCTILGDPQSKKALVIDPGDDAHRIIELIKQQGFEVTHLLHTHAHIDHVGATKDVHQNCGGEICLHKGDEFLYKNLAMQASVLGLPGNFDVLPIAKSLEHGDVIESSSSLRTEVIFTPGHTPGSVCFAFQENLFSPNTPPLLFSGDTLFRGSIGRTDLWGGDYNQIQASIKERLLTMPSETVVICGHGPQTQIGYESKTNPFFN